jgi:hypothetical protein
MSAVPSANYQGQESIEQFVRSITKLIDRRLSGMIDGEITERISVQVDVIVESKSYQKLWEQLGEDYQVHIVDENDEPFSYLSVPYGSNSMMNVFESKK